MAKLGCPTKYKSEYIDRVDDYLKENVDVYDEFHKTRGEKSDGYERLIRVNLPTIEGFCSFIGVPKSTLYDWKKTYPIFSDSLDKIVEEQKRRLLNCGLSGDYNPTIAKLILSSNHGMVEKTENKNVTTLKIHEDKKATISKTVSEIVD